MLYMPAAKPRRSCGKIWKIVTRIKGWMMPEEIPCNTRPKTIMLKSCDRPPIMLPTV